nr:YitT family protein [Clostridioides mangenotii]
MEITKRGVTFLEAEGGYTNQKRKLLYCIISTNQVAKIKELIYKKDNKAFVSINNVDEVRGGGFKTKLL